VSALLRGLRRIQERYTGRPAEQSAYGAVRFPEEALADFNRQSGVHLDYEGWPVNQHIRPQRRSSDMLALPCSRWYAEEVHAQHSWADGELAAQCPGLREAV
jgi:hypothetical protein